MRPSGAEGRCRTCMPSPARPPLSSAGGSGANGLALLPSPPAPPPLLPGIVFMRCPYGVLASARSIPPPLGRYTPRRHTVASCGLPPDTGVSQLALDQCTVCAACGQKLPASGTLRLMHSSWAGCCSVCVQGVGGGVYMTKTTCVLVPACPTAPGTPTLQLRYAPWWSPMQAISSQVCVDCG